MLAGDFKIEPQVLEDSGWLSVVMGKVAAPPMPKCNGRVYDYFIVAKSLALFVHTVQNLVFDGFAPHIASRILLRGTARRTAVRKLVKPRKVPTMLPHGPELHSECFPPLPKQHELEEDFDKAALAWNLRADAEWASLGVDRAGGSTGALKFVRTPPVGSLADPLPGADLLTVIWRAIARKADDAALPCAAAFDTVWLPAAIHPRGFVGSHASHRKLRALAFELARDSRDKATHALLAVSCATDAVVWACARADLLEAHATLHAWSDAAVIAVLRGDGLALEVLSRDALKRVEAQAKLNRAAASGAWRQRFAGEGKRPT